MQQTLLKRAAAELIGTFGLVFAGLDHHAVDRNGSGHIAKK